MPPTKPTWSLEFAINVSNYYLFARSSFGFKFLVAYQYRCLHYLSCSLTLSEVMVIALVSYYLIKLQSNELIIYQNCGIFCILLRSFKWLYQWVILPRFVVLIGCLHCLCNLSLTDAV